MPAPLISIAAHAASIANLLMGRVEAMKEFPYAFIELKDAATWKKAAFQHLGLPSHCGMAFAPDVRKCCRTAQFCLEVSYWWTTKA
jgi:hypothetical protein